MRLDPRLAFGAPNVRGVATWALKDRWESGETIRDIADDFDLDPPDVEAALAFERVAIDRDPVPLPLRIDPSAAVADAPPPEPIA
ncbi:DUF433 domain-containing protein [Salinarimonas sp.]|uniref:DUF433 domain-containing protein n=1 Tax=Salinarimonas sp. TaxID=2766526 RepID=UPI0032D900B8